MWRNCFVYLIQIRKKLTLLMTDNKFIFGTPYLRQSWIKNQANHLRNQVGSLNLKNNQFFSISILILYVTVYEYLLGLITVLSIILSSLYCFCLDVRAQTNSCKSQLTCGACIQHAPDCTWCNQKVRVLFRVFFLSIILNLK